MSDRKDCQKCEGGGFGRFVKYTLLSVALSLVATAIAVYAAAWYEAKFKNGPTPG